MLIGELPVQTPHQAAAWSRPFHRDHGCEHTPKVNGLDGPVCASGSQSNYSNPRHDAAKRPWRLLGASELLDDNVDSGPSPEIDWYQTAVTKQP